MPPNMQKPRPTGNRDTAHFISDTVTLSPIESLLERLDRVKVSGPGTYLASCPTSAHRHGDRSRGLSIREGDDGRILVHCFAGCPVDEVVAAVGLDLADLFPPRPTDYPDRAPRGGLTGRGRVKRVPWPDLFEALELDIRACSLAFLDLSRGVSFSREDAASISKMAGHLADEIGEILHGR